MGGVTEGAHDARPTPPGPSSLSHRARRLHPMMAYEQAPWHWLSRERLGTIIGGREGRLAALGATMTAAFVSHHCPAWHFA